MDRRVPVRGQQAILDFGVVALMIALFVIQILAVHFFGIEPKLRRLEEMQ